MANKWMDLLDQELGKSREVSGLSENGTDKTDKNTEKPKKRAKPKAKKKKLTPEEVYEKTLELADEWSGYVISNERALACLEWAQETDAVEIDIETYGCLKRDGLLYTRCQIRLIILHHEEKMWFIDCHHVPDETVTEILGALAEPGVHKIFHNALFDVPRLYRTYGVLLDGDLHDTMIAARVARGRVGEEEG